MKKIETTTSYYEVEKKDIPEPRDFYWELVTLMYSDFNFGLGLFFFLTNREEKKKIVGFKNTITKRHTFYAIKQTKTKYFFMVTDDVERVACF